MEATSHQAWYQATYPELTQAGLWLRGGELGTLPPAAAADRPCRVLLARLSPYADVAASMTHPLLYQIAARTPGIWPDLAYLPPRGDQAIFRRDGIPWLLGTQSKAGPDAFHLIGLSLSIVQELVNLPPLLLRSGIPLGRAERASRPDLPILLMGGASARFAGPAYGPDPWVDLGFLGEDPEAIRAILVTLRDAVAAGLDRAARIAALAALPGVFVPGSSARVRPARSVWLDATETLIDGPVPHVADVVGTARLAIDAGCPCFCAFCAESWDRKPYRTRSPGALVRLAREIKAAGAVEELEIFSAAFGSHPEIHAILAALAPRFHRLGLKSQRLDVLARDPGAATAQHALGKASVTCGIEGISARLRRRLHKSLTDDEIRAGLDALLGARPRELKLFFLATGEETDDDHADLGRLLATLGSLMRQRRASPRLVVSVTPLVRFPWTPLERTAAPPRQRMAAELARMQRAVTAAGYEFRAAAGPEEYEVTQVLARGWEPAVGEALAEAVLRTGFTYLRGVPASFHAALAAALAARGRSLQDLLAGPGAEGPLPWAALASGVDPAFLEEQAGRSARDEDAGYCLGRPGAPARCLGCEACADADERRALTGARPAPAPAATLRPPAEAEVTLLLDAGDALRLLPARVAAAALARALLAAAPDLVDPYRRIVGLPGLDADAPLLVTGHLPVRLAFAAGVPALVDLAARAEGRAAVTAALGGRGAWLGLVEPGWRPDAVVVESPFPFAPTPWMTGLGLRHTARRDGAGGWVADLPPPTLRKGILRSLTWRDAPGGGAIVHLTPGPKLDVEPFLRQVFALPHDREWVRITARQTGPLP